MVQQAEIRLQWGRRQTSTESAEFIDDRRQQRHASMGPPTNVDGEYTQPGVLDDSIPASMGPPTNVDGEKRSRRGQAVGTTASMGPPTNVDGETGDVSTA